MYPSLNIKIFCFVLVSFLAIMFFSSNVKASPIGCGCPEVTADSGGTNVCECTPPYCYGGTLCCVQGFPEQISQTQFNDYRKTFVMDSFYTNTVTPDFKSGTDESRNGALIRLSLWGTFIDASVFNDTLKDLGIVNAQTIQTYTPSEQICRIGTLSRALSASEAKTNNDRLVLSEGGLAKNLGRKSSISAAGAGQENEARMKVFVEKFCDLQNNNNGMAAICISATPVTVIDVQHSRDVDYTRLMGNGVTINADLTDSSLTQDESSVITMSHYLYGHRQPSKRTSIGEFIDSTSGENLYSEYRSVVARRAAAQNSYNTLAAMKMAGSGGSDTYVKDVLKYIGISGADADVYVGAKTHPDFGAVSSSYNAQMNLLAKQIYQDPAFYANLMESKANVKRTSAALQGIGLMQQRDTYRSMARTEMLAAILVEMEARKIANNVTGQKSE